jgi:hypothetical protein
MLRYEFKGAKYSLDDGTLATCMNDVGDSCSRLLCPLSPSFFLVPGCRG